jgi:hypothetical protein
VRAPRRTPGKPQLSFCGRGSENRRVERAESTRRGESLESERSKASLAMDSARKDHRVLGRRRTRGLRAAYPPALRLSTLFCMTKVASTRLTVTEIIIDCGASI